MHVRDRRAPMKKMTARVVRTRVHLWQGTSIDASRVSNKRNGIRSESIVLLSLYLVRRICSFLEAELQEIQKQKEN